MPGYVGYDFLDHSPNVVHVGCWAHVRRKFVEVIKAAGKIRSQNKTGIAEEAVARIGRIYAIERSMRESKLNPDLVYQERQEKVRPLIDEFHEWLKRPLSGRGENNRPFGGTFSRRGDENSRCSVGF